MATGPRNDQRMFLLASAGDGVATLTELAGGEPGCCDVQLYIVGALHERECRAIAPQLRSLAATWRRVSVDLSDVSILSASGFALLVELQRVVGGNDGEVVLAAISPAARQVLEVLNWSEVSQAVVLASVR